MDRQKAEDIINNIFKSDNNGALLDAVGKPGFVTEYPMTDQLEHIQGIEEFLSPEEIAFFMLYRRLLIAYANNDDSRFIMDLLITGIHQHDFFKRNDGLIIGLISSRGSMLRGADSLLEGASDKLQSSIGVWVLHDIISVKYGSFIPSEISARMLEIQSQAIV